MNRRAFLQLGAVSGLAIGCSLGRTRSAIWRHHQRTGEFQPNAWIRILPDDTIIFTLDRTEMGQGTMTSHTALVAEELEVDPKKIRIELAEADRAYDNPDKQIAIQITGGSTSTRSAWEPLREAGAVAREMLRAAASVMWSVPIASCIARDGAVTAGGHRATYGELSDLAAAQRVPKVVLKAPADWRLIGKPLDRLDARPKVDGTGIYGIDVKLPGLLTGVIVRPPVRGAVLARFDATKAKARRGVVDVIRIDEGVAVVANGYWEARSAAALLELAWTGGAEVDSAALFATYERMTAQEGEKIVRDEGAVAADYKLEAIYKLPYLAHATMEPQNATAWLHDGRCNVWAPTQAPGIARWRVAEAIGFAVEDVAIHTTLIGGGFGRRGLTDYCVEAARVAQRLGRPVKIIWSREDDQANDWYRPMAVSRMTGAVRRGAITGWHHRLVTQSILESEGGDFAGALLPNATPRPLRQVVSTVAPRLFARNTALDSTSVEGAAELPYAIPNLRVEFTVAATGIPVGFYRSVGHSHNAFVTESYFDELCHAAELDPYGARRELLRKHPRLLGVLDLAALKAGWGTPPPRGIGRGIAVHESFNSYCAQVIEASVTGNRVIVHRVVVALDCGRIVNPQIVAQQAESAVIFGLSAALKQQITFAKGRVQETNFHAYRSLRMFECPVIETHTVTSTEAPSGLGEPGVPPVAPALCNAIFAATGKRIRTLPIEEALR